MSDVCNIYRHRWSAAARVAGGYAARETRAQTIARLRVAAKDRWVGVAARAELAVVMGKGGKGKAGKTRRATGTTERARGSEGIEAGVPGVKNPG